jgi:hypothetical protein
MRGWFFASDRLRLCQPRRGRRDGGRPARCARASSRRLTRYIRADAVEVLEEMPRGLLFGAMAKRCARCSTSPPRSRRSVSPLRCPRGRAAYECAWTRWSASYRSGDGYALALGGRDSPIAGGLMAVEGIVHKRACEVAGDAALLTAAWQAAVAL